MIDSSKVDLIACGDALVELGSLPSGSVNLVYLDPPFFSQKSHGEKDEFQSRVLASLDAIPVQRNKGIDGFIRKNGRLIPVKIQKESETIDDAIARIEYASRGKSFAAKIVIQTNFRHSLFGAGEFFGDADVKVIPYLGLQIEDALNSLERSRMAK